MKKYISKLKIEQALNAALYLGVALILLTENLYKGFYFLFIGISIFVIIVDKKNIKILEKETLGVSVLILLNLVPYLVGILFNGEALRSLDKPVMLFLIVPLVFLFRRIKLKEDFFCTVTFLGMSLLYGVLFYGGSFFETRVAPQGVNPVAFGYVLVIMFCFELVLKARTNKNLFLKGGAILMTFSLIVLSGTRMAILSTVIVSIVYILASFNKKRRLISLVVLIGVLSTSIYTSKTLQNRLTQTQNAISLARKGELKTSIGYRFEMWKAAFNIGWENPILGAGSEGHIKERSRIIKKGVVIPEISKFVQYHNVFLDSFAKRGLLGALGASFLLFIPFFYFFRKVFFFNLNEERRRDIFGLIVFLAFILFALTDSFLESNYVVRISMFMFFVGMATFKSSKENLGGSE